MTTVIQEGQVKRAIDGPEVMDDKVSQAVAKMDPMKAGLAALVLKINSTVYDIKTDEGESTAKALRAECVSIRTQGDKLYKEFNAPLLVIQRKWRELLDWVKKTVEPLELRLDAEIKAKEAAREAVRMIKVAAQEARIQALREKISAIAALPARAVTDDASALQSKIALLSAMDITEDNFAEFVEEALSLRNFTLGQLDTLHLAATNREAQAESNRQESSRLAAESLRMQEEARVAIAAAKKIVDDAAAAAQALVDAQAAERKRQDAENTERQRQAEEDHAKRTSDLKKQMDAFEAEKQAAKALADAAAAKRDAEKKAIAEQIAAQVLLDNPPPEKALEKAPALTAPAPAATNIVALNPEKDAAAKLVWIVMSGFSETEIQAIDRLLSLSTRQALRFRQSEISGNQEQAA